MIYTLPFFYHFLPFTYNSFYQYNFPVLLLIQLHLISQLTVPLLASSHSITIVNTSTSLCPSTLHPSVFPFCNFIYRIHLLSFFPCVLLLIRSYPAFSLLLPRSFSFLPILSSVYYYFVPLNPLIFTSVVHSNTTTFLTVPHSTMIIP